jgi:hypothetical protein
LDDLREFTEKEKVPVFVSKVDFEVVQRIFPYLVDTNKATGSGYVSQIQFELWDSDKPFDVLGLKFTPLIVNHGPNNTCHGFIFNKVVYMSDSVGIPLETEKIMSETLQMPLPDPIVRVRRLSDASQVDIPDKSDDEALESLEHHNQNESTTTSSVPKYVPGDHPIDIMIVDSLQLSRTNPSHWCFSEAVAEIRRWRPKKTYLVGMGHEFDYNTINHELANLNLLEVSEEEKKFNPKILTKKKIKDRTPLQVVYGEHEEGFPIDVEMAYDGLKIEVHLLPEQPSSQE